MTEVAARDVRNRAGQILDRVERGQAMTITRYGRPIAELRPLPRDTVQAALLLQRWRNLPVLDRSSAVNEISEQRAITEGR